MTKRLYSDAYSAMVNVSHTIQTPAFVSAICDLSLDDNDVRFMVGTVGAPNAYLVVYEKDGPKIESYHEKAHLQVSGNVSAITLLPTRVVAVGFEDGHLRLYKLGDEIEETNAQRLSESACTGIVLLDNHLYVGTECGKLMVVNATTFKRERTVHKNMTSVIDLCEVNDHTIACAQLDGSIVLVDTMEDKKFEHIPIVEDTSITAIANHPEFAGLLAFGTSDGQVGFLDTNTTTKSHVFSSTSYSCSVWKVAFHPNKSFLMYSASDNGAFIEWDVSGSGRMSDVGQNDDARCMFTSNSLRQAMEMRHLIKSTAPISTICIIGDRYIAALECSQVQIVRTVPEDSIEIKG
ncbi:hypothetical protein QR680_003014 [Steinernema hermaphroditum]|uniref:Uncharacterized protein n=1 Tax=Steinernema hermaphroditum TaxID=289476 RepID=A0AA39LJC8_9BILA|nr:hypothetical protein QR680_003014 [Steinernema hermaphroditum]